MNDFLVLDTDVASYLLKNSPRATPFLTKLEGYRTSLAFVSVAEMFKLTLKRHWGPRKIERLESALRRHVVIPYDRDMAWDWAHLTAACEGAGRPIAASDAGSQPPRYATMRRRSQTTSSISRRPRTCAGSS